MSLDLVAKYAPSSEGALRQGEIITGLIQIAVDVSSLNSENQSGISFTHPFAVILSQDCDLDQDFKARQILKDQPDDLKARNKLLPNVLFCMATTAEALRNRDKLLPENKEINASAWSRIIINKDERYHFLEKIPSEQDAMKEGLEELGIDFKRYFTIPTDEVYARLGEAKRRSRLLSPYLEHLSLRFSYYQARVGLPEDHSSD